MNRIFFREKEAPISFNDRTKTKICVIGLGDQCGKTFIGTCLANYSKTKERSVAFLQLSNNTKGKALLYDSVAMNQRFDQREFVSFHHRVFSEQSIRNVQNIEESINWAIITPEVSRDNINMSSEQKKYLLNNTMGEIIIATDDEVQNKEEYDFFICVIDPKPSKLFANDNVLVELKKLEMQQDNVIFVVNRMNDGVPKKEIQQYIKSNNIIFIKEYSQELFYEDEFKCKFHFKNKKLWDNMQKSIKEIYAIINKKI